MTGQVWTAIQGGSAGRRLPHPVMSFVLFIPIIIICTTGGTRGAPGGPLVPGSIQHGCGRWASLQTNGYFWCLYCSCDFLPNCPRCHSNDRVLVVLASEAVYKCSRWRCWNAKFQPWGTEAGT